GIETQPLHILRKAAVPCRGGSGLAVGAVEWRQAVQLRSELSGVSEVVGRILGKDVGSFRLTREGAAQHRLMNEIHAKLGGMLAGRAADVVTNLIFLLVANNGKRRDGRNKLVVAVGFEAGNGLRSGAERKRQRKAEVSATVCCTVQITGTKGEISHPRRAKGKRVAEDAVLIVGVRRRTGGGQRGLLYQSIVGSGIVERVADEPLRTLRLRPVESHHTQVGLIWNAYVGRHADRSRVGNQSLLCQLVQRVELRQAVLTVIDAGVLVHHLEPGKNPDLVLDDRSADRSHVVLPREGLLGLRRRVVDWKARIQRGRALKHRKVAVPVVGSTLGADDHRGGSGPANVSVRLRGLHGKFPDHIG